MLGFELGYSMESPNALVIWEAQFGDFANTAQVIIDQFVATGEFKWLRMSGLVMLLPHGLEGQGPEHSSARLERFLQCCNDDEDVIPEKMAATMRTQVQEANWQVCNITSPANFFHALRRQVHRDFRKPLICMSPKSGLKHKLAVSDLNDLGAGTRFHRVIKESQPEVIVNPTDVERLVFCSGKVYFDLVQEREARGVDDVAIVRLEQIAPFPYDVVQELGDEYPNAQLTWCQEEHKNMGACFYVRPRLTCAFRDIDGRLPDYVGRGPSASPATGLPGVHEVEKVQLMEELFGEEEK